MFNFNISDKINIFNSLLQRQILSNFIQKKKKIVDFDDDGNAKIDRTRIQITAFIEDPKKIC